MRSLFRCLQDEKDYLILKDRGLRSPKGEKRILNKCPIGSLYHHFLSFLLRDIIIQAQEGYLELSLWFRRFILLCDYLVWWCLSWQWKNECGWYKWVWWKNSTCMWRRGKQELPFFLASTGKMSWAKILTYQNLTQTRQIYCAFLIPS